MSLPGNEREIHNSCLNPKQKTGYSLSDDFEIRDFASIVLFSEIFM